MPQRNAFEPDQDPNGAGTSGLHRTISAAETPVPATSSQLDADLLERLQLLDQAYRVPPEWLEHSGDLWFETSAWVGVAALCWALALLLL